MRPPCPLIGEIVEALIAKGCSNQIEPGGSEYAINVFGAQAVFRAMMLLLTVTVLVGLR